MRHASPIARLTLAATLLCAAGAAAQPRVRVRAESRIELRTERPDAPGSVLLQGVLRDDLGAPLPGREVELQVRSAQGTALRATRRTDRDGAFEVELELAEGDRYQVTAAFAGDAGHERLRVERGLDLARAETHVTMEVPDRGRIDLDRESHEVGVRVRTPLGGGGLPVELLDELDRPLARGTTDADGRALFVVASEALGAPGPGRLKARTPGDRRRADAQTEVPIVRVRAPRLTLEASPLEGTVGDSIAVEGGLEDSHGPLPDRAVGLFLGDAHVETVLTDAEGRFRASLVLGHAHAPAAELAARFESDTSGRPSVESDRLRLSVRAPRTLRWLWSLVPLALTGLLLLLAGTRERRRESLRPAPPQAGVTKAARSRSRPADARLVGQLLGHRDGRPLAGRLELSREGEAIGDSLPIGPDGRFEAQLGPGRWNVRFEAEGHAPHALTIDVPHRGEWAGVRVRLETWRARALALFRDVATDALPGMPFDERTLRELQGDTSVPADVRALGRAVERAFYAADAPDASLVAELERRARAILEGARARREDAR